jgi:hypothetical protein
VFPQHPDDLLLAEAASLHRPSPFQSTDSTLNWRSFRGARHDLSVFEFRISDRMPDFITVHTFGGRGSPSF